MSELKKIDFDVNNHNNAQAKEILLAITAVFMLNKGCWSVLRVLKAKYNILNFDFDADDGTDGLDNFVKKLSK